MTRPTVTATAETLFASLGPWADFDGESTGWATLHLCEALVGGTRLDDLATIVHDAPTGPPVTVFDGPDEGGTLGETSVADATIGDARDWHRPPLFPNNPGWSILLDVDQTPDYALDWLAQFVGAQTDPDASIYTNRQLVKATQAWRRGTLQAVVAAARLYLKPPGLIEVHERDGSAYRTTVRVYKDQVSGATYAELAVDYPTVAAFETAFHRYTDIPSTARIRDRIGRTKPAGIVINLVISQRCSYRALQQMFPTVAAFQAALPTWAACASYRPPGNIFTIGA